MTNLRRLFHFNLVFLIALAGASAATITPMTLDVLIERSDYVLYGRVLGNRSIWDSTTRTIWTQTELLVLDGSKGRPGSTILITEPGGVLGDVGQVFPGVPRFEINQEVVVFLHGAPGNLNRVTGLQQGVYRVKTDAETLRKVAQPSVQQRELVYADGRSAAPQSGQAVAVHRLDDFLNLIRLKAQER